jgi:S1-C subfamily serine protease
MRYPALLLGAALAAAGCGGSADKTTEPTTAPTPLERVVTTTVPTTGGSMADVVERVLPGVVNVQTTDFDGRESEASGVVIDKDGIVVTNFHVIRGARRVDLRFNDARHHGTVRGQVIGTAAERDLAIIRVDLHDLSPIPLGRSATLRLGDGVLAIGFPLGLGGPTVTQGIVSGLDRTVHPETGPALEGLLQTDAAINPGNSGGALIDFSGRLVGINTAAAEGKNAENVGFSIAIDEARLVIDEIRSKPSDKRSWIGASLDSVDSDATAVQLGVPPATRGAVVVAVFAGSPAARAGVREGDVIVSSNGSPVTSSEDVTKALLTLDPGDSMVLELLDRSGPRRVTLSIAKRPATLPGG